MRASLLLLSLFCFSAQSQQPANSPKTKPAPLQATIDAYHQAEDLLEKGDYKAAEPILIQLAKAAPSDARLQYDLGFTEEHNGEDTAAATAYAAAIKADSSMAEAHVALGLLEARQGHADVARAQLVAATASNTTSPALHARALRALAHLDASSRPDDATHELLEATQLTGEQPGDADLSASLAAHAGGTPDAENAYRRALARSPDDLEATVGLASLLQQENKLTEADSLLTPALALHPGDPRLVAQTAALYAAEDKSAGAITLLEQLRSSDPAAAANPSLTRLLAHLQLVSGNAAAADPLYRTLVAANPNDPLLLDDFGSTLVREQHFAEAQSVLTRAVNLRSAFHDDAAWGDTAGHLAFAASRNHQPEVALQALEQRATVLPNSPASLFLEATARDALHQNKQARESYRAFLAAAGGKLPDEEFEARHRLVALEHEH